MSVSNSAIQSKQSGTIMPLSGVERSSSLDPGLFESTLTQSHGVSPMPAAATQERLVNERASAQEWAKRQKDFLVKGENPWQSPLGDRTLPASSASRATLVEEGQDSSGVSFGVAQCQADKSLSMRDRALAYQFDVNGEKVYCFAICDGYGEAKAASFIQQNLVRALRDEFSFLRAEEMGDREIESALQMACIRLNEELKRSLRGHVGTSLVFTLILGGKLWTANLGSTTAVLLEKEEEKEFLALTRTEMRRVCVNTKNETQVRRIQLGFGCCKGNEVSGRAPPFPFPRITCIPLSSLSPNSFLLLFSTLPASPKQVVGAVNQIFRSGSSLGKVCESIVACASALDSSEDHSFMIVGINGTLRKERNETTLPPSSSISSCPFFREESEQKTIFSTQTAPISGDTAPQGSFRSSPEAPPISPLTNSSSVSPVVEGEGEGNDEKSISSVPIPISSAEGSSTDELEESDFQERPEVDEKKSSSSTEPRHGRIQIGRFVYVLGGGAASVPLFSKVVTLVAYPLLLL